MSKQKVHIIGVCGKTSSAVANMFKKLGLSVTGSDQGTYPPVSEYLKQNGIQILTPYKAANVPDDVELVVVAGNALIIDPQNPEYLKAKELNVPILTFPDVLNKYLIKENSIVVAGNFGKGTITGALIHVMKQLHADPSYMVGGQLIAYEDSLAITKGDWSIVEGDEYPTPPLDGSPPKSKFFYYDPKYLILTSAEWDHYDKFPTEESYVQNYINVVKLLPTDGLLVANLDGRNIEKIIPHAPCPVITYSHDNKEADFVATDLDWSDAELFGRFNYSNLTAAYAMLTSLNFDQAKVKEALLSYQGLEYRMQKIHEDDNLAVIRDLAHSPVKAHAALSAVREKWPEWNIIGIFEIFSSSLKKKAILPELQGRFDTADTIIIPKVDLVERLEREDQVTGKQIVAAIGSNAYYMPKDETILEFLAQVPDKTVVILMSSGGLRGLPKKYLDSLKKYETLIS